jgi:hypothetical protein
MRFNARRRWRDPLFRIGCLNGEIERHRRGVRVFRVGAGEAAGWRRRPELGPAAFAAFAAMVFGTPAAASARLAPPCVLASCAGNATFENSWSCIQSDERRA